MIKGREIYSRHDALFVAVVVWAGLGALRFELKDVDLYAMRIATSTP